MCGCVLYILLVVGGVKFKKWSEESNDIVGAQTTQNNNKNKINNNNNLVLDFYITYIFKSY